MTGEKMNNPRTLDLAATFNARVAWVRDMAAQQNAPGLLTGLSGTDSILAFLIAARAFEQLGKPERVAGVHFGPQPGEAPAGRTPQEKAAIAMNPAFAARWIAKNRRGNDAWFAEVADWLRTQAPQANVEIDSSIDSHDDYQRWAALFRRAVGGPAQPGTCTLATSGNYWIAGSRNATEQALGTYSNISGAVSIQPLTGLWKSEILELCEYLDVPRVALEKSEEVDCGCGRIFIAAENIEAIDAILMTREGALDPAYLQKTIPSALLQQLEAFVDMQTRDGGFKSRIPYKPGPQTIISL